MKRKLPKYDNGSKIKLKDGVQTNKVDNTRVNYTPTFSKKPFTPENWATNINEIQPDGKPNPKIPGLQDATLDAMILLDAPLALGKLAAKGLSKAGVGSIKDIHKLNPYAFKPNPENFYRQVGKSGIDDLKNTKLVREAGEEVSPEKWESFQNQIKKLQGDDSLDAFEKMKQSVEAARRPASPFFSKGETFYAKNKTPKAGPDGKVIKRGYDGDASYLLETSLPNEAFQNAYVKQLSLGNPTEVGMTGILKPNPSLRQIENFKVYKQDWLQGYKEMKKYKSGGRVLPKYGTGNIVPGYNIGKAAIGAGQEVQNTNQLNTNAGISMGAGAVSSLGTAAIDTFVDPNKIMDNEGNLVASYDKAGAAAGKGALKYGAMGAQAGMMVGGPLGAAIGGGIGAIGGATVGLIGNNKEKDVANRSLVSANNNINGRLMTRNVGSTIPMVDTNMNNYAKHGALISGPNAEVEGGEAIDLPENGSLSVVRGGEGTRTNSNSFMINGNSHEQSGIDIKATPGARVFNKEYSKIVNPINKAVGKMEKRLERTPMNLGLQAAIDRLNSRKDQLFEKQQMENESKNLNKFRDGGPIYEADNTGIYAGATTALLNNAVQSNRINNLPRPRTIQAPTFYAGSAPTPIDNSAELAQIGADVNAGRQMLRRGTSGATMGANLGNLNAIKAQANNRVYNAANTLNATRRDAYSERQAAAINAGIEAGYKTDVMNTENQANFNAWRVGAKNSATAGLTKDLVGMTNLYTDKENQKAELDAMLAANITGTGGRAGYVRPKARKFFKI